ncbi:NAD/NADP-dependent octopine/nopaline dehydrogenase family protein [Pseudonocardia thermophila]|uniref:NAD/NADP-dependent octopine/nopaline dehydrogenase family protein n=1 Tax=Pseudonocardia thermophila TaxID=1848 RepID=UPI00248E4EAD|nr:NAD/NADP-dependent octopine/nopaline dehydrogenase family protein [Pseudonocardia thermophila]
MSVVAVFGAGNGGLAAAAHLSLAGHRVRLFSRSAEPLDHIRAAGGLTLEGVAGTGTVMPELLTNDPAAAVEGADVVMLVVPATALHDYGGLLAPHLREGLSVFLNPGGTGGALAFTAAVRAAGFSGALRLAESSTLTYACRIVGPARVRISNLAPRVPFAAFPGRHASCLREVVSELYPAVDLCSSVLETGLANLNAVEHPPQALLNTGWIEHTRGDFYFYYEGTTESVGRVIDRVDAERMALAAALGVPAQPFVEAFRDAGYTTAEAAATGSAYVALQHSEPNRWFKSPPTIDHRYVHEDVGYGLVPWSAWARLAGVATPVIDGLIAVAGAATGRDYLRDGLTAERMGIAGLSRAELDTFLAEGGLEVEAR